MIDRLRKLLILREARVAARQAELARMLAELAEVDRELAAVDDELRRIDTQRRVWENQWQSWLQQDGVLWHGQEYNLYHLTLSAWESDVKEQRLEVDARYQAAAQEVSSARAALVKAQHRVDFLRERLADLRKVWRMQRLGIAESQALEDLTFHGRFVRQALE